MTNSEIIYFAKKWVESEIRELEKLLEARKWLKKRLEEYERKLKQLDAIREWLWLNDIGR